MDDFRWTEATRTAAQLVARGNLTYQDIAVRLDIDPCTLWRWRQDDAFKAGIEEERAKIREEVRRIGIADPHNRIAALNDRWNRMRRVIEERADDPSMADVPGGKTGLMVRTIKRVVVETDEEGGRTNQDVEEFAVDTALLKELREHEKQAAQELGQWEDRSSSSVTMTANIITLVEVPGGIPLPSPPHAGTDRG